jgi:hypothetical protein
MSKNKKVMSIAIEPDLHDELKSYARKKGLSVSAYIGTLVGKAVKLSIDDDPVIVGKPADEDVIPVMLKIPANLKGDKAGLESWLSAQVLGIVNKLG